MNAIILVALGRNGSIYIAKMKRYKNGNGKGGELRRGGNISMEVKALKGRIRA